MWTARWAPLGRSLCARADRPSDARRPPPARPSSIHWRVSEWQPNASARPPLNCHQPSPLTPVAIHSEHNVHLKQQNNKQPMDEDRLRPQPPHHEVVDARQCRGRQDTVSQQQQSRSHSAASAASPAVASSAPSRRSWSSRPLLLRAILTLGFIQTVSSAFLDEATNDISPSSSSSSPSSSSSDEAIKIYYQTGVSQSEREKASGEYARS